LSISEANADRAVFALPPVPMVFVWVDLAIRFAVITLVKGTYYKSTDVEASRTCLIKHS
jgi:hypothetical protein